MSSNSGNGKVVCVSGASGFIASWLVKLLLLRGYTVKCHNDPRKVNHLLELDGAKERLHLFQADLLEEGSFDRAIEGCEGVFHTASPVAFDFKDPQTEIIDPAVKGTLCILKSCTKSPTVKRVVLTSSMAAVAFNEKPVNPEVVVDETWFSDPSFCRQSELWYQLSKTLAEDAAWKFAKENNIDMVVINPSLVIGPLLQPFLNESSAAFLKIINGGQILPQLTGGWINVKDVANAHIQAFEIPTANGRYCLVESVPDYPRISKILRELYPTLQLPEDHSQPSTPKYQFSKEKARTLGIEFIPLEVGLKEIVESLKEKNFINL